MIILGNRYQFTELELKRISNIVPELVYVAYKDREPKEVLDDLTREITNKKSAIIVLNIKSKIPSVVINYLTVLQFEKTIKFYTLDDFMERYLHKCYIPKKQNNINYLSSIHRLNLVQYIIKRMIDIFSSMTIAIIAIFLLPIIIYKIRKQSPGSLLFAQTRVGKNNKPFRCYKFRTMHEDSHHDPYTRENDTRIYPWGSFMRKTRIDEIPQIINIIKGEMHLIGPRAEWDILVKGYEQEIPYYNERHLVAPGITGWAQVMYPYGSNVEDSIQKLMYDLYYIKNWSLWLEFKTICKTIMVVLGKKGV